MTENRIKIIINKPISEVFEYTTNPANTQFWFPSIVEEQTNEWPAKVGTKYRNRGADGIWSEYTVFEFKKNELFGLVASDGIYHVRYTYKSLEKEMTELEYFEWVDSGFLENPFTKKELDRIKPLLENINKE